MPPQNIETRMPKPRPRVKRMRQQLPYFCHIIFDSDAKTGGKI
ncbi:hypothetical protein Z948_2410 [Sulfitobacter donghicola DSW-25 = KCTC 12864 = JCM 14565]|nr:hypothetical protein Z948_2410 [Sulfitobacter donghicola DSW-25 = KCTC 12864 = JCM 14565]